MINRILILFFLLFQIILNGQLLHETRAVWVATNYQIDWPHSTDFNEQQKKLKKIFDDIASKKFNTVYFQTRSNGTVIYPSDLEPFSPYFTGVTDSLPPYDPLLLAIKEAHQNMLEIHAWINVFKCFAGTDERISSYPGHLLNTRKKWVIKYKHNGAVSYWLDPGNPEVREYLIKLIKEEVVKYDLDGINLDYLRYPGKDFDDETSFRKYGNGKTLAEWRRGNIILFLSELYREVKKIKPYLKIGVAALGIYKNELNQENFASFSYAFQDTYSFLKNKIVDYVSPQVYWSSEDEPPFGRLVGKWVNNSSGRNIVIGIGIYKNQVAQELESLIGLVHSSGAAGFALFRYGNIMNTNLKEFGNIYLPAKMLWLSTKKVRPVKYFKADVISFNPVSIDFGWDVAEDDPENIRGFGLVELNNKKIKIIKLIPANRRKLKMTINNPLRREYRFSLVALDRLWNESKLSNSVVVENNPQFNKVSELNESEIPALIKRKGNYVIVIFSDRIQKVQIYAYKPGGKYLIVETNIYRGKNLIEFKSTNNIKAIGIMLGENSGEYLLNLNSN